MIDQPKAHHIWHEPFKIHSYEIGPSSFATPQAICRFLQEAASNHATNLGVSGDETAEAERMWVLSQLSLRMEVYPRWHETIQIDTWPVIKVPAGVRGHRDFVLRYQDGEQIGSASTIWLYLNQATRRPLRIPQSLQEFASVGLEQNILNIVQGSDLVGSPYNSLKFRIRGSDIDWNRHVNNVCYVEWALETLPADFRLENSNVALDITFVAEGKYGHDVIAETFQSKDSPNIFFHRISEKDSSKTLGLLRTAWAPKAVHSDPK